MNIFLKQITRKWVFTSVLALLLAFAIGFSCIGYSAWLSTRSQILSVDSDYTTIAVPLPRDNDYIEQQWIDVGGLAKEDGSIYWSDGAVSLQRRKYCRRSTAGSTAYQG